MTLIIQKPTGAKLVMAQTYVGTDDPDAAVYVAAVEAADGQSLETATRVAIHSFVKGCKADGIWPAIKASCILAGARTLAGALVPLAGAAPTNVGGLFVSGDYNRKTGLVGDGSTKYLNSNRTNRADPQNNAHLSIYISNAATTGANTFYIGARGSNTDGIGFIAGTGTYFNSRNVGSPQILGPVLGFAGHSRSLSFLYDYRLQQSSLTQAGASSLGPETLNYFVFARNFQGVANYNNARLAFYSIGESLNLALLDTRVTDLINAFAAAIP